MAILENIQDSQVVRAYRQGWLAWLGAHKTAFDLAQDGVAKLMNNREKLVEELVQKGENVEELATANFNKVRGNVETRVNGVSEKVSEVGNKVFSRTTEEATDRVSELSEEVAKLAKTVSTLSRKINATQKPATKKKAPAKRPTAKKAATPKTKAAPVVTKTETEAKAAA
jgi:polyhydroxyalkanoate synthesis regulator phasin